MRIALFTDTFPPVVNGGANAVARSARALAQCGHEVCVFTVSDKSSGELERMANDALRVVTLPSVGLPIYIDVRTSMPVGLALGRVKKFRPDIIHSHTPLSVGW